MMLKGTLYEVGNLDFVDRQPLKHVDVSYGAGSPGRGIRIDIDGSTIEIIGLSQDECRSMVKYLNDTVTVWIEPSNDEALLAKEPDNG